MYEYYKNITEGVSITEQIKKLPSFLKTRAVKKITEYWYGTIPLAGKNATDINMIESELNNFHDILFLCTGNICRSPFAEEYFRDNIETEGTRVYSAGLKTKDGRESPENAKIASEKFNVSLAEHKSKVATRDLIEKADVVLLMDWYNYHHLRTNYPDAISKSFLLGTIDECDEVRIVDPHGHGIPTYIHTFNKVKRCIDNYQTYVNNK